MRYEHEMPSQSPGETPGVQEITPTETPDSSQFVIEQDVLKELDQIEVDDRTREKGHLDS